MFITVDELKRAQACEKQVLIFEETWPNGVEITSHVVNQALDLELDMLFFVRRFLGIDGEELLQYCGCRACNHPRGILVNRIMEAIAEFEEGL